MYIIKRKLKNKLNKSYIIFKDFDFLRVFFTIMTIETMNSNNMNSIKGKRNYDSYNESDNLNSTKKVKGTTTIKISELNSMNCAYFNEVGNNDYSCVKMIEIDNNWKLNIAKMYVNGSVSLWLYNFINLEKLIIKDIKLKFLPNFEYFHNLKYLEIANVNLSSIPTNEFNFPKSLKHLNISTCNLANIPEKLYDILDLEELFLANNEITSIHSNISKLSKLKFLKLCGNNIKTIPNTFIKLTNLECLGLNNNPIGKVDTRITSLTKLTKLLLNSCELSYIDDSFENLVNLDGLDLANNPKLQKLPDTINNNVKLKDISLENIGLDSLPETFFQCKLIERLKLTNNPLSAISSSIGNLINLKFLEIHRTNLLNLPDTMGNLVNIKELYLHNNKIKSIPDTFKNMTKLITLDCHSNNINSFGAIFENLSKLKTLDISNNDIIVLPTNIIYAKSLMIFNYYGNPIISIQPQVKRFIDTIINGGNFVNDTQSIHNSTVQKNLIKSIENITSLPLILDRIEITQQIIIDTVLSRECKMMIEKEFQNNEIHSILQMNFREIFEYIWTYIHTSFNDETQYEIKKIINIELLESKDLCFIGKITRLVGSLNGFSNLAVITISDSEYISNSITNIKNILNRSGEYTVEKHRSIVREDLATYGISNDIIEAWLEYIE